MLPSEDDKISNKGSLAILFHVLYDALAILFLGLHELLCLTEQSQESVQFLKELEEWGSVESPEEKKCRGCGELLAGSTGYRFPCGHCFHSQCLVNEVRPLLDYGERFRLDELLKNRKPTRSEAEERDNIVAGDCPCCGMISSRKINLPIVVADAGEWALDLPTGQISLKDSRKKGSGMFSSGYRIRQ